MSGAAPLGSGLVNRVLARFESKGWKGEGSGVVILQGYGLTETSPTALCLSPKDALRKVGTTGVLMPHLEARLMDDEERDVLPTGEGKDVGPGELWLRTSLFL